MLQLKVPRMHPPVVLQDSGGGAAGEVKPDVGGLMRATSVQHARILQAAMASTTAAFPAISGEPAPAGATRRAK